MTNLKEEPSDSNSHNAYLDDESSPYLNQQSHASDEETLSENSRKIRKKRNAYCKISDDIRMNLLEAVQNGETLKSAAKRHKINYSSAKSILHTYRKEGRILKKSAQERTMKKKGSSPARSEQSTKAVKPVKKEKVKIEENTSRFVESLAPFAERMNSVSTAASFSDESNQAALNYTTVGQYSHHQQNNETAYKVEEPTVRGTAENENTFGSQGKLFDNLFQSYPEYPSSDHIIGGYNDYSNFMNFSNEFESFNDTMAAFQSRLSYNEDFFQDPSGFLCTKEFNTPNVTDEKHVKLEAGMDYFDHSGENAMFKGFMDTQKGMRQGMRKNSFVSYSGSFTGYRKNSFDLF